MKKALLLAAAILLAGALAACGGDNGGDDVAATPTPEPRVTPTPAPGVYYIMCEEFEGLRLYRVRDGERIPLTGGFSETRMNLNDRLVRVSTANIHNFELWEGDIDATPNETMHLIGMLQGIQDHYNMEFQFHAAARAMGAIDGIRDARLAGETIYELLNINIFHTGPENIFEDRHVMDLFNLDVAHIIDFYNQPWDQGSLASRMWDRQHGVHFMTQNSGEMLSAILVFNRDLTQRYLPPGTDLYGLVQHGYWNFSTFETTLRWINANSSARIQPFAYYREQFLTPGFIFANGGEVVSRSDDGVFTFTGVTDQNTIDALHFLQRLTNDGLLVQHTGHGLGMGGYVPYYMLQRMAQGQIAFITGEYRMLRMLTRHDRIAGLQHNAHFGLLPIPKGDHMDDFVAPMIRYDMWYIVNDIPRPDEIAAVLVAMANRLAHTDIVYHEYRHGVMDSESAEILAMLLEKRVIDWSRILNTRAPITGRFNTVVQGHLTPAAALQGMEDEIEGRIRSATVPPELRD